MSQYSPEEGTFIVTALGIGCALSFLVPISVSIIDWYLDLGLHFEVVFTAWLLADFWTFPTAFYLLYHPITLPLPIWLTFGQPVTFGGIAPNVCKYPTLTLEVKPPGGWPCFPAHLKDRVAHLVGPEGWKYLVHLDAELILCLAFLVINLGLITFLVHVIRKPRYVPRLSRETCSLCGQRKVGKKSTEKSDCEKQQ